MKSSAGLAQLWELENTGYVRCKVSVAQCDPVVGCSPVQWATWRMILISSRKTCQVENSSCCLFSACVLFCLFWAWNIFRLVSPWSSVALPGEEQETQCYITTLCSVNLLPTLSFFCLLFPPPVIFFLPPLFAVNSTEIQYVSACHRYIQNNLITAITFLPGWLTPRPQPLTAAPMCSILLSSYSYLTELHVPFISLFFMFSFFLFYSNTVCWLSQ